MNLLQRLSRLRMLILDVDGTLTDGRLHLSEDGTCMRSFSVKDGLAMRTLTQAGCLLGWISHSSYPKTITERAQHLHIPYCYVGHQNKGLVMEKWRKALQLAPTQIAVMGDDLNDKPLFERSGLGICPADATPAIRNTADIVLNTKGGHGCIEEWMRLYFLPAQKWAQQLRA